MSHDDFQIEPVLGLPEALPKTEEILWQGRPNTWALAKDALNFWWVMGYFVLLAVWRFVAGMDILGAWGAMIAAMPLIILGGIVAVLLLITALIQARCTVYTITNKRVAMRIGAALTVTLNIPYRQLDMAQLGMMGKNCGNIALQTLGNTRFSFLVLWPHARPWSFAKTQPTLRAIPNARDVAAILGQAAHADIPTQAQKPQRQPASGGHISRPLAQG